MTSWLQMQQFAIQRALTTGNLQLIEAAAALGRTTQSTSNFARVIYERPSA
jgi:hypothetical protein